MWDHARDDEPARRLLHSDGIAVRRGEGRARITVGGSLDMERRDAFAGRVREVARDGERVEIDLRELEFIDSVGLSSILVADRVVREAGGRLTVLLPDAGPVRKMFELTLLHLALDVRTG